MLSARELGLKVRPHRNITSRVSSGFAFLVTRPPAKHPFYNSSVGFTYVSTDIIYKKYLHVITGCAIFSMNRYGREKERDMMLFLICENFSC